jgi:hypothetical protein
MTLEEFSQKFYRDTRRNIEKHGQSLVLVGADGRDPGFVYTIGNAERGLPELLAVGVAAAVAMNALGAIMREMDRRFADGAVVDIGGKCPVRVIDACPTVKRKFTIQAGRFLETDDYDVQQVVVPDPQGRFPGDPDCAAPWRDLPLYPRKPEGRLQ